jgi:hypothetical protein
MSEQIPDRSLHEDSNPQHPLLGVRPTLRPQRGTPGAAVAMLLSPESGWINGQRIEASGGMNL